jgi:hypothetical protein
LRSRPSLLLLTPSFTPHSSLCILHELTSHDGQIHATSFHGLERLTYTSAQFTMSKKCPNCGSHLATGFAHCLKCRAIRPEFKGLEQYVTEETGYCVLSAAATDVKGSERKVLLGSLSP